MDLIDRRKEPRHETDFGVPLKVKYNRTQDKTSLAFRMARDISFSGVRTDSTFPVEAGDTVTIRIGIQGQRLPIEKQGRVRWSTLNDKNGNYSVGIEFLEAHNDDYGRWKSFVARQGFQGAS